MKVKLLLIIMGSILFFQSCAPSQITKMAAVPSRYQKVGYQDIITSQKKHFVSMGPYTDMKVAKDKTIFMLNIQNCGEDPISITYNNISVIFQDNSENRTLDKITVQTFDVFMEDLAEEYSTNEKEYIASTLEFLKINSESPSSEFSEFDSIEYDIMDLREGIEQMRTNNSLLREALDDFVVKPQTIMPGDSCSGIFICDTSEMDPETEGSFRVIVSVEREEHQFTFNRNLLI